MDRSETIEEVGFKLFKTYGLLRYIRFLDEFIPTILEHRSVTIYLYLLTIH
jgi:hypothetical protein